MRIAQVSDWQHEMQMQTCSEKLLKYNYELSSCNTRCLSYLVSSFCSRMRIRNAPTHAENEVALARSGVRRFIMSCS